MSLQLARGVHRALERLRASLDTEARDWRLLSLVKDSSDYNSTLKSLGHDRCARARRHFERHSGQNKNILDALKKKGAEIFDPLSGGTFTSRKAIAHRKYHFLLFSSPSGPGILACVGSRPQALFYLDERLWIDIKPHKEDHHVLLRAFHTAASDLQRDFLRYLSDSRPPAVACIVGDERPTHFIRESLGGIQNFIDSGKDSDFWDSIDYLIVPTDNSFLITDELFEPPPTVKTVYLPMGDLNRFIATKNVFAHRLMRSGSHMTDSLRDRILLYADHSSPALEWPEVSKLMNRPGYVTVWFGVEIEKDRIQNQEEVLATLLSFLNSRFGDNVQLIIDGWSPNPLSINAKDRRIISSIRAFTRKVMNDCVIHYATIDSYTMPYRDKIRLASEIDFFVTMHGSAAIVPSLIRRKPGITYHSAWGMTIDHEVWTPTLYRTPTRDRTEDVVMGRWVPFDVDIPAFRATLDRLVADHAVAPRMPAAQTATG